MGSLDFPAQFGRKVKAMLNSLEEGRAAHRAGNIKASGQPLEEQIRLLLSDSLPTSCKVASGYFYGASSVCSGEIDVLIYEDHEAFRLDPAKQAQHYVPYTSVSIMGQVKNSANDLTDAIEQTQNSMRLWLEMKNERSDVHSSTGLPYQDRPVTFIVCGTCTDAQQKNLSTKIENMGRPLTDYILFLDRGEIVAGDLGEMFNFDSIDFLQYRNVSSLHLCRPEGGSNDDPCGLALLWFYFALVSKLSWDKGNNLRYHGFCRQISSRYPLRKIQKLI